MEEEIKDFQNALSAGPCYIPDGFYKCLIGGFGKENEYLCKIEQGKQTEITEEEYMFHVKSKSCD